MIGWFAMAKAGFVRLCLFDKESYALEAHVKSTVE